MKCCKNTGKVYCIPIYPFIQLINFLLFISYIECLLKVESIGYSEINHFFCFIKYKTKWKFAFHEKITIILFRIFTKLLQWYCSWMRNYFAMMQVRTVNFFNFHNFTKQFAGYLTKYHGVNYVAKILCCKNTVIIKWQWNYWKIPFIQHFQ